MRSFVLAIALAAPLSAVAAPLTFTRPSNVHQEKLQQVSIEFVNDTVQDREVLIGSTMYKMRFAQKFHIDVPVGTSVRVFSETNSKVNGQQLMQVSATDEGKSVFLK